MFQHYVIWPINAVELTKALVYVCAHACILLWVCFTLYLCAHTLKRGTCIHVRVRSRVSEGQNLSLMKRPWQLTSWREEVLQRLLWLALSALKKEWRRREGKKRADWITANLVTVSSATDKSWRAAESCQLPLSSAIALPLNTTQQFLLLNEALFFPPRRHTKVCQLR